MLLLLIFNDRMMGHVLGGIAAGVVVGYPLGGVLYDFVGKTFPFLVITICLVLLMVGVLLLVPFSLGVCGEERGTPVRTLLGDK